MSVHVIELIHNLDVQRIAKPKTISWPRNALLTECARMNGKQCNNFQKMADVRVNVWLEFDRGSWARSKRRAQTQAKRASSCFHAILQENAITLDDCTKSRETFAFGDVVIKTDRWNHSRNKYVTITINAHKQRKPLSELENNHKIRLVAFKMVLQLIGFLL